MSFTFESHGWSRCMCMNLYRLHGVVPEQVGVVLPHANHAAPHISLCFRDIRALSRNGDPPVPEHFCVKHANDWTLWLRQWWPDADHVQHDCAHQPRMCDCTQVMAACAERLCTPCATPRCGRISSAMCAGYMATPQ
jgi:hypothetical protein